MAGLYRRGVQRSAGGPVMRVQGAQGAGGAIPRGGTVAPSAPRIEDDKTDEKIEKLGGLIGMMQQQKLAEREVEPAMTAVDQTQENIANLPNARIGAMYNPVASTNGEWGGASVSAFGPGVPMSAGQWNGASNGAVPNFAANAGLELPGMSTAPIGAQTPFGGGLPGAAANTTGQAAGGFQLPGLPQGLLSFF